MQALERAMVDMPDLFIIKLELPDLAGDLLAFKLKQLSSAIGMKLIVYTPHGNHPDEVVTKMLLENAGIPGLVKSGDPCVLLKESELLFRKDRHTGS